MPERKRLFEEFPPVSKQEWMERITTDLKGADFHKKLVWKTNEGFEIMPFYRREDILNYPHLDSLPGDYPWIRGSKTPGKTWLVRQNLDVENCKEANSRALYLVDRGVDSLGFIFKKKLDISYVSLKTLLEGIIPGKTEINIVSAGKAREAVEAIIKLVSENNIDPQSVKGAFEADPLGRLMINGKLCTTPGESYDFLADLIRLARNLISFRLIQVNVSHFSDSGADTVTELAYGLSMGNEYMAALTARGIAPGEAASRIRFSFGLGSNYFFEIAKLRAARMLWALIINAYKPADESRAGMEMHCVTSRWNKTLYDPYVNMLRTQTEAMSAVLGGTDSLTVEPFDILFKKPDDFSERIARNQQLLLKEEAYFGKVADPAGGSYYIETLTMIIAEHAWKLFVDTERQGGFLQSLRNGTIQKRVKECALKRLKDVSSRKEILIGTTQFPEFNQATPQVIITDKAFRKPMENSTFDVEPLPAFRAAQEIEKIRLAADSAARRPSVFILPAGKPAMAVARAQFSGNFFACGGYKIIDNPLFGSLDEGINAAMKMQPDIIVLCSSDEEYAKLAPELYGKASGKAILVVAGNPPCMEDLEKAGLKYFISIRSDLVGTLIEFHRLTGLIDE